jgi:preprotein translocase subunit SecD
MQLNIQWRFIFIATVILLCIYGLFGLPTFPTSLEQVRQNFADRIRLGLDLRGGTHMILQVQVQEAVKAYADQTVDRLRKDLSEKGINAVADESKPPDETHVVVSNLAPEQAGTFRDLVSTAYTDWDLTPAPGQTSGYSLGLKSTAITNLRKEALRQSVETIRRRIDQLGLTEPVITEHGSGDNEILVQLPGEGDPTRAKGVIQAGGQLELRLVADDQVYESEAKVYEAHQGVLPPGTEPLPGKVETRSGETSPLTQVWYLVERIPAVTGRDLRNAKAAPSPDVPGRYEVLFTLSVEAGRRFGVFTEANVGKRMAIVLERRVETAPTINSKITDSGRITGQFGKDEANDLALVLRSGALPASIKYLEERTVGPSLGADSIRQGFRASVVSLIAVMIFMLVYYRLSGVNAVLALFLNLLILLAALAYFQAVLTLPGIAGVILTIGMGVDSNVLVFERIREELRGGKANAPAVEAGFGHAFLTIIDTHVTTVVSAVFLFFFGSGPVRGFAVTLVIGLISNVFTAVYVSRTIFGWHLGRLPREQSLSI